MDVKLKLTFFVILISFLLTSTACNKKTPSTVAPPHHVIAKDTLVLILADFHVLEASLTLKMLDDKTTANMRNVLKDKIYKDYNVSKERFFNSYAYYEKKPIALDSIYCEVITEITQRQSKLTKP